MIVESRAGRGSTGPSRRPRTGPCHGFINHVQRVHESDVRIRPTPQAVYRFVSRLLTDERQLFCAKSCDVPVAPQRVDSGSCRSRLPCPNLPFATISPHPKGVGFPQKSDARMRRPTSRVIALGPQPPRDAARCSAMRATAPSSLLASSMTSTRPRAAPRDAARRPGRTRPAIPDPIDAGSSLLLVAFAQPVQSHHALLLDALDRHEAHAGPRSCFAVRRRIGCIVLAGLAAQPIGGDEVRRDQLYLEAHRSQPPAPVVRSRAGLHRDDAARWQLRTPRDEPVALQLFGHDHSPGRIHRVNLNDALG